MGFELVPESVTLACDIEGCEVTTTTKPGVLPPGWTEVLPIVDGSTRPAEDATKEIACPRHRPVTRHVDIPADEAELDAVRFHSQRLRR